jgi:hypothetical protein
MHLLTILLFTLSFLLSSIAIASPLATRQFDQEEYYLKTRTTDPFNDKNNLYVIAYHTGAGLNDVLLIPNMTRASKGYFIDGYQMFEFRTIFPWRMNMGGTAISAGEILPAARSSAATSRDEMLNCGAMSSRVQLIRTT